MQEKIVIGIVGEMASGKGTIAKHLASSQGAVYWSFSRILRDVLDRLYIDQGRKEISDLSLSLRTLFGEDLLAEVMSADIERHDGTFFVIEAIRREQEIFELRKLDARVIIFYIETDIQKRYDRLVVRGENAGDRVKSFEEFKSDHEHNTEITIAPLRKLADHVIVNDGSLDDLKKKVDVIVGKVLDNAC